MARAPFKLRSGNTSAFKNLGSSPAKQQKVTEGFSGHKIHGGPTTIVTTPTQTGTSYVETSQRTGEVVGEGSRGSSSKTTKTKSHKPVKTKVVDLTKRQDVTKYVKGTKAYKAANPSTLSKVAKVGGKVLKKGLRFFGGKALGVAGMLQATSATATQPGTGTHGGKKQTTYNPKTGKYE